MGGGGTGDDRFRISTGTRRLYIGVVVTWAALSGLLAWTVVSRPHLQAGTSAAGAFVVGTGVLVAELIERDRHARRSYDALVGDARHMVESIGLIADSSTTKLESGDMVDELLTRVVAAVDGDGASVALFDGSTALAVRIVHGIDDLDRVDIDVAHDEGLVHDVVHQRGPRRSTSETSPTGVFAASVVAPLVESDRVIGIVEVGTTSHRTFSDRDLEIVSFGADRIAAAVTRARADDAERRARLGAEHARTQLSFLAAASAALARATGDHVVMLRDVAASAVFLFADVCLIDTLDDGSLTRVAAMPAVPPDAGKAVIDAVCASGVAILVKDVDAGAEVDGDARRFADELSLSSALVVPITLGGLSIGVLTLGTMAGRRGFRRSDLAAAEDLANRIAVAIERAMLFAESEARAEEAAAQAAQLRRLMDAALAINSRLSVRDVAGVVAEQARSVVDAAAAVVVFDSASRDDAIQVAAPDGFRIEDVDDLRVTVADLTATDGTTTGCISVVHRDGPRFAAGDASALVSLAQMASVALENARLYDRVADDERRLQSLLDTTPVAIVEVDGQGTPSRWNPAAATLFRWDGDGTDPSLPDLVAEASAPVRAGEAVLDVLVTATDGDRPLELSVSAVPLDAGIGADAAALIVVADLTERRDVEAQLHQAQRLEAMARLAGAVAHDFNNLLTVVVGYSELVLRREPPAELVEPLEAIRRAGSRASELTRQLLTISRRDVVERVPVCLDDVVASLETVLRRIAGEAVALELALGAQGVHVLGDPGQLEQVVLNLVINACDAMPSGGSITITSRVDERDPHSLHFAVADSGVGMDEETAARCFEPFFTTKARTKGTGLGLSTAYATVVHAGGTMSARSTPGEGTTFEISMPVTSDEPGISTDDPAATPNRHATGCVLLVEDDDDVRDLVRDVLELDGWDVVAYAMADDALAATTGPPDVVVTDIAMPGTDGLELVRRLRETHGDVPVVFISGYPEEPPALAGDTVFLAKPFTEAALLEALRSATRQGDEPAYGSNR